MSTLDDYTTTTGNSGNGGLVEEDETEDGARILSTTCDGVRYWFTEVNATTLQVREVEVVGGGSLGSGVVDGVRYEDLPPGVRMVVKRAGYTVVSRGGVLAEVME